MRKLAISLAAVASLAFAAPAAAATLISEDFESGFGSFVATGQANINTGNDYIPCCGTHGSVANMANHFVDFGSGNLPSGMISSPFDLIAGESYHLEFDFGALGAGSENLTLDVAGFTFNLLALANNDMDSTFSHVIVDFSTILLDGPTTLEFHSQGVDNVDAIVDNVVLTGPVRGAVPEPATWAMMLLGFAGIGFAMRKRTSDRLAQLA